MPLPFWRGDRGVIRAEMTWDDDVSPVGGVVNDSTTTTTSTVTLENTVGYFIVEWFRQDRFAGLVGDISLTADQLKLTVKRVTLAAAYYHWQNLNSGARAPSFVPGESASISPGPSAFLLRPGFQRTNAAVDLGSGAGRSARTSSTSSRPRARALSSDGLPWLGRSEVVVLGQFAHNFSVVDETNGWGGTVGLAGGDAQGEAPTRTACTAPGASRGRRSLATFADSDLGGGHRREGFRDHRGLPGDRNLSLTCPTSISTVRPAAEHQGQPHVPRHFWTSDEDNDAHRAISRARPARRAGWHLLRCCLLLPAAARRAKSPTTLADRGPRPVRRRGTDRRQQLRPVERVPRAQFAEVGQAPLGPSDMSFFVYPSLDDDERESLLEGLTFFTTEHTAAEGLGPVNNQTRCMGCHLSADEAVPGLLQRSSHISRAARSTPTNFNFTSFDPATGGGRAANNLDALTNTGKTAAFTIFGDFSPSSGRSSPC